MGEMSRIVQLRPYIFAAAALLVYSLSWFTSLAVKHIARAEYLPVLRDGFVRQLTTGGTDDHSIHFELFGGISSLDIMIASISVLIIVCAVQMVEYLFHTLHLATHDTPFNQMVHSIEKELMVVGFTAFIFKIIVNTTSFLELEWFHSLEYADVLIPLFSFAYCGLGIMLILVSIRISSSWSQAHHHKLVELLDSFYNLPGLVGYLPYGLLLAPFTPTIARMEFRIFQSIFCETYKIQKAAFAFNEYVEKVFEKYILMIIEIRPLDWLLVCVLVLLNWARVALSLHHHSCGDLGQGDAAEHDDHYQPGEGEGEGEGSHTTFPILGSLMRRLGGSSGGSNTSTSSDHHDQVVDCEDDNARVMFEIAGGVLLLLTVLMALESRRLEVSIMRQKGIRSIHTYPSYLKYTEESSAAASAEQFRLNEAELRASAEEVKYATAEKESHFLSDRARRTNELLRRLAGRFSALSSPAPSAPSSSKYTVHPQGSNSTGTSEKASVTSTSGAGAVSGKRRPSASNKFSASVKQAWVSKRNFSKRDRRKSLISGAAESSARIGASIRSSLRNIQRGASKAAAVHAEVDIAPTGGSGRSHLPQGAARASRGSSEKASPTRAGQPFPLAALSADRLEQVEEREDNSPPPSNGVASNTSARVQQFFSAAVRPFQSSITSSGKAGSDEGGSDKAGSDKAGSDRGSGKAREDEVVFGATAGAPNTSDERNRSRLQSSTSSLGNVLASIKEELSVSARLSLHPTLTLTTPEEEPSAEVAAKVRSKPAGRVQWTESSNNVMNIASAAEPSVDTFAYEAVAPVKAEDGQASSTDSVRFRSAATAPQHHHHNQQQQQPFTQHHEHGGVWVEDETAIAEVFFLHWPELYLEGVQSLIMLIALYYALYFTNFIVAAGSPMWKVVTLLPAVLSSTLLIYIVKCAVILSALHAVDCDAILEVLDQTEGARVLSAQIRERVVSRLQQMGPEPQAELFDLFAQIDSDGNGTISREEFTVFMSTVDIRSDRRRWMQVFRSIDVDFDSRVSFEEFFLFLFPDHSVGLALKKKKERILEMRVQQKADKRADSLASLHRNFNPEYKPATRINSGNDGVSYYTAARLRAEGEG